MTTAQKNLLLTVLTLLVVVTLLVLCLRQLPPDTVDLKPLNARAPMTQQIPLPRIDRLLQRQTLLQTVPGTNQLSPFYTTFFQPPPPKPPPQPPSTKNVALTYAGFIEAASGPRQAYVFGPDGLLIRSNGAKLIADFGLAEIELKYILLTNATSSNRLEFNVKKDLSVPIQ